MIGKKFYKFDEIREKVKKDLDVKRDFFKKKAS